MPISSLWDCNEEDDSHAAVVELFDSSKNSVDHLFLLFSCCPSSSSFRIVCHTQAKQGRSREDMRVQLKV